MRAGEIFALAGVQGNGQTELTEALVGLRDRSTPAPITLDGDDVTGPGSTTSSRSGVGYVPEDRLHDGLVGSFTVAENLVLDLYDREAVLPAACPSTATASGRTPTERVAEFDVRTPSIEHPASTLSGGNQQKVVLARELSRPLKLLVVAQPTRGLDVGSIEFVHKRIVAERDNGAAVILVSTELDEVLGLADRIACHVPRQDRRRACPAAPTRRRLGLLMAGAASRTARTRRCRLRERADRGSRC